jgi:hypothetical protein
VEVFEEDGVFCPSISYAWQSGDLILKRNTGPSLGGLLVYVIIGSLSNELCPYFVDIANRGAIGRGGQSSNNL